MDVQPERGSPNQGVGADTHLDITDFARQIGFSVSTVRRLKKAGRLTVCQPGGPRSRMSFPRSAWRPSQPAAAAPTPASPGPVAIAPATPDTSASAEPKPARRGPRPKWRRATFTP